MVCIQSAESDTHLHMWNGEENVKTEEVKKEEEQERGQVAGVWSWEDQLRELAGKGLVLKLVLTGGPCGGKTLAQVTRSGVLTSSTFCRQAEITRWLKEMGWTALCCPEVATIVFQGGVDPSAISACRQKVEEVRTPERVTWARVLPPQGPPVRTSFSTRPFPASSLSWSSQLQTPATCPLSCSSSFFTSSVLTFSSPFHICRCITLGRLYSLTGSVDL